MKQKTRSLKIIVGIFCLCLVWIVPKLIVHVFSQNFARSYIFAIMVSLGLKGLGIGMILYATFRMIFLFEHDSIFTHLFVRYLKLVKYSLLGLTIISLFNFGLMPSIAIVHWNFFNFCAFTIDFMTIFMFGLVAFMQLIICTIKQGIELKEEQSLTI